MSNRINDNGPYIHELPHSVRQKLCAELDSLNIWVKLANAIKLYPDHIQKIKTEQSRGNSPSNEILNIWGGQYNHKVLELLIILKRLELFSTFPILKDYVDRKYYLLLLNNALQNQKQQPLATEETEKKINKEQPHAQTEASTSSGLDLNENKMREIAKAVLEIDYEELREATDNWNTDNILGKGGFGIVFKGCWKHTEVAIKVMDYRRPHNADNNQQQNIKVEIQQSLNELKHLHSYRHDNILPLYGYSIKGKKPCLVYQLMKCGSLETKLSSTDSAAALTWQQRYSICVGTARGIYFLHNSRDKPLIHGDVKPANILLDQSLQPKIGDFGLVREGPHSIHSAIVVSQVYGTKTYLPPEFIKHKELSIKVDTYSYGIVLLETFTGLRAYRLASLQKTVYDIYSKTIRRELYDTRLKKPQLGEELDMCNSMIEVGLECTNDSPQLRPDMGALLNRLSCYKNLLL